MSSNSGKISSCDRSAIKFKNLHDCLGEQLLQSAFFSKLEKWSQDVLALVPSIMATKQNFISNPAIRTSGKGTSRTSAFWILKVSEEFHNNRTLCSSASLQEALLRPGLQCFHGKASKAAAPQFSDFKRTNASESIHECRVTAPRIKPIADAAYSQIHVCGAEYAYRSAMSSHAFNAFASRLKIWSNNEFMFTTIDSRSSKDWHLGRSSQWECWGTLL